MHLIRSSEVAMSTIGARITTRMPWTLTRPALPEQTVKGKSGGAVRIARALAPKSSVFACFGVGRRVARLPFLICVPTSCHFAIDPRAFPLSLPSYTHTLSLTLSHFSSTLVARFFARSHAATTQWTPTPIASKTGRRPLAHRLRVPASRASFVHRPFVHVASPILPIPLKLSSRFALVVHLSHAALCLWQGPGSILLFSNY